MNVLVILKGYVMKMVTNQSIRKSYYNNGKPIYLGKTIKEVLLIKYRIWLHGMQAYLCIITL
jgi:hypothetical protein